MNHAPKAVATLCPLFIRGKWRVGFTAARDLHAGDELTWDYGCPPKGIEWLGQRPKHKHSASGKQFLPTGDCHTCGGLLWAIVASQALCPCFSVEPLILTLPKAA